MNNNSKDLNYKIEPALKKVLSNNHNSNKCYKNVNKHSNCSESLSPITIDNYKKDQTVCRNCYNTNT